MKASTLFVSLVVIFLVTLTHAVPIERRDGVSEILKTITGLFKGKGTFFHPVSEGGAQGACGPMESDHSMVAALNLHQYGSENGKSKFCGKNVLIKHNGKKVKAKINDACPGCDKFSLDLTPDVFIALDALVKGVIDIEWCVIGTDDCEE